MERYIIDAQRDAATHDLTNTLLEFVEWAGKGTDRPLSYTAIEGSFFKEFLHKRALDSPIDLGLEQGNNPRELERQQLVRIMSLFAEIFFIGKWDPEPAAAGLRSALRGATRFPKSICALGASHARRCWPMCFAGFGS